MALIARQVMLARASRREALGALADANGEEAHTSRLATRTRALAKEYRRHDDLPDGQALSAKVSFAAALNTMARDAERAGEAAKQQVDRRSEVFARVQDREKRLSEKLASERKILREQVELRAERQAPPQSRPSFQSDAILPSASLARGLHGSQESGEG